jgi:hypothetical protein
VYSHLIDELLVLSMLPISLVFIVSLLDGLGVHFFGLS